MPDELNATLSLGRLLGVEKTKSNQMQPEPRPASRQVVQAEAAGRSGEGSMWRAFSNQVRPSRSCAQSAVPWERGQCSSRQETLHCRMACMMDGEEVVVERLRVCKSASDHRIGWVWSLGGSTGLTRAQIPRFPASTAQPRAEQGPPPTTRDRSHFGQGVVQPGPVKPSTDCFSEKDGKGGCRGIRFCHSQLACLLRSWKRPERGGVPVLWASTQTDRIRPEQPGSAPGVFLASGLTSLPGHDAHCESVMAH
jgi:hypothetical protein